MASFGALRYPWQPLLDPYRTPDLCPVNLCPKEIDRVKSHALMSQSEVAHGMKIRYLIPTLIEYRGVQLERLRLAGPGRAGTLDPIPPTYQAALLPQ